MQRYPEDNFEIFMHYELNYFFLNRRKCLKNRADHYNEHYVRTYIQDVSEIMPTNHSAIPNKKSNQTILHFSQYFF